MPKYYDVCKRKIITISATLSTFYNFMIHFKHIESWEEQALFHILHRNSSNSLWNKKVFRDAFWHKTTFFVCV